MLAALLPRLALDRQRDEDFLRGSLGAASSAVELGRLVAAVADPATPREVSGLLARVLEDFAAALERVARGAGDRGTPVAQAEAVLATAHAGLAGLTLVPGSAQARAVLRAGASLRFIADRFGIDRPYFERSFAGE